MQTFAVIADTRERDTAGARERYKSFGVPVYRATLDYGDYCGLVQIDGAFLYDMTARIQPTVVVERKMSLDELAMCFTRERPRFKREFERAKASGATIYLLVENGSWEAIQKHRYKSRFTPKAFQASLIAWIARYDLRLIFCKADTSGSLIKEILYREIKERLERGELG